MLAAVITFPDRNCDPLTSAWPSRSGRALRSPRFGTKDTGIACGPSILLVCRAAFRPGDYLRCWCHCRARHRSWALVGDVCAGAVGMCWGLQWLQVTLEAGLLRGP